MTKLYGKRHVPLAVRLRPSTLAEVVGQEHLLGEGAALRKLIESEQLASIVLFGPAGTGKTTIAEVIARTTKSDFVRLNATQATVKDIRACGTKAEENDSHVVVFVDEIHRLSQVQQDALLPFVENGYIISIGATTENPYHSIGSALLSRSQLICELEPLKPKHLAMLIMRVITTLRADGIHVTVSREAAEHIVTVANGDGRKLISIMEVALAVAERADETHISLEIAKAVSPSKHMVFGNQAHFDLASAYQGSIQASDPDAAIYWLAKWLESGEDPRYIARRMLVSASEDASGNPAAATIALAAYTAACEVGRPECDINLAHATIAIATSPRDKSAAMAIWAALKDVREGISLEVPKDMRDCHYAGAEKLGHGSYHDGKHQDKYVGVNKRYYKPKE